MTRILTEKDRATIQRFAADLANDTLDTPWHIVAEFIGERLPGLKRAGTHKQQALLLKAKLEAAGFEMRRISLFRDVVPEKKP